MLTPIPMPKKMWQIHKAPTKWSTCWHPTRLARASITPVVSRERNIQSCNVPHTGLVLICSHIDVEDRFYDKIRLLNFWRASAFCYHRASELNNTATPPPHTPTKLSRQIVKGVQSPIYLAASLLFSTIVAVVEVEVGRRQVPKVEFFQYKEWEAQNKGSLAKPYI